MKRCLSFLLLLFLFVFGAAAPDAGPGENAAHLYAGRPQLLPFEVKGEFVIRTRHGRILGSGAGAGQLTVQVPELEKGGRVEAVIEWDGRSRDLVFHHPLLLPGLRARTALAGPRRAALSEAGVVKAAAAQVVFTDSFGAAGESVVFFFPPRNGLPWKIPDDWRTVALHRTKNAGTLSVQKVKEDFRVDTGGRATYIEVATARNQRIFIFDPGFDLSSAENMLIIQQIVKEAKK